MRRRIINLVAIAGFVACYGALMFQQGARAVLSAERPSGYHVEKLSIDPSSPVPT